MKSANQQNKASWYPIPNFKYVGRNRNSFKYEIPVSFVTSFKHETLKAIL